MKSRSLIIGINSNSILSETINIDAYKGNDKTIVFLKEVSEKMRENEEAAFAKYFDCSRPPSNKNIYHLADINASNRESLIYAMFSEKDLFYLVIGDDGGPKSVCVVHSMDDGMKIISGRPKSGVVIPPVFMESALVVDCVRKLKGK